LGKPCTWRHGSRRCCHASSHRGVFLSYRREDAGVGEAVWQQAEDTQHMEEGERARSLRQHLAPMLGKTPDLMTSGQMPI